MGLLSKKPKPVDRGRPWIDIQPDVVIDREWDELDVHVRVARRGWSWVIRWPDAEKYVGVTIGDADTYEEALDHALAEIRST